ncbi:hypothetical protein MNEG_13780 [Monoraphidium neglectum]|uniref:MYND-type domain-containing protein n=1 Tax=Monoraphidium neglectum TaxID=145388 RepID=A0A0D2MGM9_9CHLO|nr:hypothetical protein MNEG_13780 [Monoraphidium neglectum]KIY94185.1 hypothetical protein MNEG_13780 [Monoraphidium neglectum]|eukprot:XP_013893205.1 hypothetical protein MNEG_13780 [Monoraphidium neglectum]
MAALHTLLALTAHAPTPPSHGSPWDGPTARACNPLGASGALTGALALELGLASAEDTPYPMPQYTSCVMRPPRHCGLYHAALLGVLGGEEGGGGSGEEEEEEELSAAASAGAGAGAAAAAGADAEAAAGTAKPAGRAGGAAAWAAAKRLHADARRRRRAAAYAARHVPPRPRGTALDFADSAMLCSDGQAQPEAYVRQLQEQSGRVCWACARVAAVPRDEWWYCTSCQAAWYCSEACSEEHRGVHAPLCGVLGAARAAARPGRRLMMDVLGVAPEAAAARGPDVLQGWVERAVKDATRTGASGGGGGGSEEDGGGRNDEGGVKQAGGVGKGDGGGVLLRGPRALRPVLLGLSSLRVSTK